MRQRKLTDQQRIDAVTAYLAGAGSYQAVAEQFQISSRTLRDLVALYQYHGPDALKSSVTNNTYPPELKRQAVEEYQSGQGTQRDICLKYNIRARTQLRKKKTIPGRKTTLDERINIVSHCLANDRNYELSARTHSVSYQQVYSWVKKYDAYGLDGLLDGRGRHRDPARMDPLERAEYENKILQDKITRLETEVLALKKLRDLERRWD